MLELSVLAAMTVHLQPRLSHSHADLRNAGLPASSSPTSRLLAHEILQFWSLLLDTHLDHTRKGPGVHELRGYAWKQMSSLAPTSVELRAA
jgi:hypothetical protein